MKKLVVLAMVLAISGVASAALTVNVIGTDRDLVTAGLQVMPSDIVTVQVVASGEVANIGLMIGSNGPAVFSVVGATNAVNSNANGDTVMDLGPEAAAAFGYGTLIFADMAKAAEPLPAVNGLVINLITFHCEGPGDVMITLFDPASAGHGGELFTYGSVIVNQIPEPMTLGLLSLGGLFLRRRMA